MTEPQQPTPVDIARRELDSAIAHFKHYNGDGPAREHLLNSIDSLIKARITDAFTLKSPFVVCNTDISDEEYEQLLKPGQFTPMYPGEQVKFAGAARPTCAQCGALMVESLCSRDAAHYQ
jgi:hypothetical protein